MNNDQSQIQQLEWNKGPANGGHGTDGGDLWNDGDTLLIVVETNNGGEVICVNVSTDDDVADMTRQDTGDCVGWQLSDISWWAILNDKFPKN